MRQQCPNCNSEAFKRNGYTRHGKQNHRCLECGRQFSLEPYTPSFNAATASIEGQVEALLIHAASAHSHER